MDKDKQEICTIRIIFPVDSDDQAIEIKKKISEILKDKSDAQIQFGLTSGDVGPRGLR